HARCRHSNACERHARHVKRNDQPKLRESMSDQNAVTVGRNESGDVQISCDAPDASTVFVAGIFNDRKPAATPLEPKPDGEWAPTLPLPLGRHEFKLIVDGEWCYEPGRDDHAEWLGCCGNDQGTETRVIEV
ncbi:MAG: glycogen-binding domain-containing protein, partial [Chthoniobacteraceae bacterium]